MEKSESIFINRELSWLDFDSRVLALAKEKTVPLGERCLLYTSTSWIRRCCVPAVLTVRSMSVCPM